MKKKRKVFTKRFLIMLLITFVVCQLLIGAFYSGLGLWALFVVGYLVTKLFFIPTYIDYAGSGNPNKRLVGLGMFGFITRNNYTPQGHGEKKDDGFYDAKSERQREQAWYEHNADL